LDHYSKSSRNLVSTMLWFMYSFMVYNYKNGRVAFKSGRVISVAASLPNNVNTSKSITLLVH